MQADRLAQLQADLDRLKPGSGLVVNALDGDVLVVTTPGAAWASKLRQLEPSLVAGLVSCGWKVSRIKVRPQPGKTQAKQAGKVPREPIPGPAMTAFAAVADTIDHVPLKEAITNLLRHHRR